MRQMFKGIGEIPMSARGFSPCHEQPTLTGRPEEALRFGAERLQNACPPQCPAGLREKRSSMELIQKSGQGLWVCDHVCLF